jgi:acyl-CoA thioester hydrolase
MARIKIDLPQKFGFQTELPVRITDINYGGHLGNDSLLALIHEARVRFLQDMGYSEHDIEGVRIIMSDAAIVYMVECFYGDVLRFQVTAGDFSRAGCDIFYRVANAKTGTLAAEAKTGIVFYDYQNKKVLPVPEGFRERFV